MVHLGVWQDLVELAKKKTKAVAEEASSLATQVMEILRSVPSS